MFFACHDSQVEVKGLVLMGASLTKEVVPPLARTLLQSPLGRHMLRPLLRSEVAQVTNRRAWHDASKLTSETLDLYKVSSTFSALHLHALRQVCGSRIVVVLLLRKFFSLLQAPLYVENWDEALLEICKTSMTTSVLSTASSAELVRCVSNLSALVVAGTRDTIVPIASAQTLVSQLPNSVCLVIWFMFAVGLQCVVNRLYCRSMLNVSARSSF